MYIPIKLILWRGYAGKKHTLSFLWPKKFLWFDEHKQTSTVESMKIYRWILPTTNRIMWLILWLLICLHNWYWKNKYFIAWTLNCSFTNKNPSSFMLSNFIYLFSCVLVICKHVLTVNIACIQNWWNNKFPNWGVLFVADMVIFKVRLLIYLIMA